MVFLSNGIDEVEQKLLRSIYPLNVFQQREAFCSCIKQQENKTILALMH
jgi:hypothetical protein